MEEIFSNYLAMLSFSSFALQAAAIDMSSFYFMDWWSSRGVRSIPCTSVLTKFILMFFRKLYPRVFRQPIIRLYSNLFEREIRYDNERVKFQKTVEEECMVQWRWRRMRRQFHQNIANVDGNEMKYHIMRNFLFDVFFASSCKFGLRVCSQQREIRRWYEESGSFGSRFEMSLEKVLSNRI